MPDTSFDIAVAHVLLEEAGLVDNPNDPGGRTNLGITQRLLDRVRKARPELNLPRTVDELVPAQAREIYRLEFWRPLHGDELPAALALWMLDTAVNQGVPRAVKWLQQALGVKADGWIGSHTIGVAHDANLVRTLSECSARRAYHYMLQDSIDDDFGLGWARRLFRTYNASLKELT